MELKMNIRHATSSRKKQMCLFFFAKSEHICISDKKEGCALKISNLQCGNPFFCKLCRMLHPQRCIVHIFFVSWKLHRIVAEMAAEQEFQHLRL